MKNSKIIRDLIHEGDALAAELDFSLAIEKYEEVLRKTRDDKYKSEEEETLKKIDDCEMLKIRYKAFEPKIRKTFQAEIDIIKNTIVKKEEALAISLKEIAKIEPKLQDKTNQIDSIYNKYPLIKNSANRNSPKDFSETIQASIDMVFIKGGTFKMGEGSAWWKQEGLIRDVTLSDYYIGKYPVTQEQWEFIMGNNPSHWKEKNLPVESVTRSDMQEFIKKLNQQTEKNYQLPTEAQWEYAARGGEKFEYPGSNDIDEVAWFFHGGGDAMSYRTHPVGLKKANGFGLYDMSGNVAEMCNDRYGDYVKTPAQTNPQGPNSGSRWVMRGGTQKDYNKVFSRGFNNVSSHYEYGFRLAMSVS